LAGEEGVREEDEGKNLLERANDNDDGGDTKSSTSVTSKSERWDLVPAAVT
jgi:hypothetical protein